MEGSRICPMILYTYIGSFIPISNDFLNFNSPTCNYKYMLITSACLLFDVFLISLFVF